MDYKGYLDTVFVVYERIRLGKDDRYIYKKKLSELSKKVPINYLHNVILPICFGNQESIGSRVNNGSHILENVLYIGATYDTPVNGIYSFFPCRKKEGIEIGFPRFELGDFLMGRKPDQMPFPIVEKDYEYFNKNNKSNITINDARTYWNELKKTISKEYYIGVKAYEPKISSNASYKD
jgi:hypothetical protein